MLAKNSSKLGTGLRRIHDERIADFSVDKAGEYQFDVETIEENFEKVREARLYVTANDAPPNNGAVVLGILLIVGAIAGLGATGNKGRRR